MPAGEVDLTAVAQIIGAASGAITPPVVIWLLIKRVWVSGAEVTSLQAQLALKDAALERKDERIQQLNDQNQALNKGLMDTAVPALARAALILEKYHTDTTVRRSD